MVLFKLANPPRIEGFVCENRKGRFLGAACNSSKYIAMVNHARPILKMLSLPNDEIKFCSDPAKYKDRRRIFIVTGGLLVYVRACDAAQSIYNALATFGKKKWDLDWAQSVDDLVKVDEDLSAPLTERLKSDVVLLTLTFNEWENDPPATRKQSAIAIQRYHLSEIMCLLNDAVLERASTFAIVSRGVVLPHKRGAHVAATEFRHPVDARRTKAFRGVPGLAAVVKTVINPVVEKHLRLHLTSSSILVGPKQLPHIHAMVLEAAEVLGIPKPQLYIEQSPEVNAYTLAVSGKKKHNVVVVHTALVDLLNEAELKAVIAHELGHLACDHGVWVTLSNLLHFGISIMPLVPDVLAQVLGAGLAKWERAAELSADRASLLVAGDPKIVCSVLMKLSGGSSKLSEHLNVDAFIEQARAYDKEKNSALGNALSWQQTLGSTHPLPVYRAREIDDWSRSDTYASLEARLKVGDPL